MSYRKFNPKDPAAFDVGPSRALRPLGVAFGIVALLSLFVVFCFFIASEDLAEDLPFVIIFSIWGVGFLALALRMFHIARGGRLRVDPPSGAFEWQPSRKAAPQSFSLSDIERIERLLTPSELSNATGGVATFRGARLMGRNGQELAFLDTHARNLDSLVVYLALAGVEVRGEEDESALNNPLRAGHVSFVRKVRAHRQAECDRLDAMPDADFERLQARVKRIRVAFVAFNIAYPIIGLALFILRGDLMFYARAYTVMGAVAVVAMCAYANFWWFEGAAAKGIATERYKRTHVRCWAVGMLVWLLFPILIGMRVSFTNEGDMFVFTLASAAVIVALWCAFANRRHRHGLSAAIVAIALGVSLALSVPVNFALSTDDGKHPGVVVEKHESKGRNISRNVVVEHEGMRTYFEVGSTRYGQVEVGDTVQVHQHTSIFGYRLCDVHF